METTLLKNIIPEEIIKTGIELRKMQTIVNLLSKMTVEDDKF